MKRILTVLYLLLAAAGLRAQTTVLPPDDGIEVRFRRCIVRGTTAYLDFTLTNVSDRETVKAVLMDREPYVRYEGYETVAYDDEGKVYDCKSNRIGRVTLGGDTVDRPRFMCTDTPLSNGIPVKVRMEIRGIDEFATTFRLVKVCFRGTMTAEEHGQALLQFKDVPLVREQE